MSIRGWAPGKEISSPRGMWPVLANRRKGTPSRGSYMQNCRSQFGTVRSRPGTSPVFNAGGKVTGIFNWITPSGQNLVLYQDGSAIKSYNQATATSVTLTSGLTTTRSPSFAPLDVWTYYCGSNTAGAGTFQVEIFDSSVPPIKAFRAPPVLNACTAVDGGAGQCTAGTHLIGFVYQNRTGYQGVPVTTVSGTPISVTLGAGLRKIDISVTLPAQPDGGTSATGGIQATLFLIATRADNPNIWYFIPDDAQTGQVGERPVPNNALVTLNFVMNLSDEDIASSLAGDTAQKNFFFLTQDGSGNGPFNPNFVVAYGQRMCYGAGTTLYASDIGQPQQIAADTNAVRMQNQRYIGAAFQLPGNTNLYLTGDRWLGYVTDNSDSPSTWAQPVGVSDKLGSPFANCVCAETGGNWVWMVTEVGPYLFDGAFGENPLTYLCSGVDETGAPIGWNRVNWNAAYAIQIKDVADDLKLYIAVPLDGATEPNFMFCIDYRMGKLFDTVDISLDLFNPAIFGSIGVVQEFSTGRSNLWIGPGQGAPVVRLDMTTPNDLGAAVWSFWESGLVRAASEFASSMIRVGAIDIWARGNAPLDFLGEPTFQIFLYGPDHVKSVQIPLLSTQGVKSALTAQPGITYMSKFDINQIENYTVAFGTFAIDSWFELSMFRGYAKQDLFNR